MFAAITTEAEAEVIKAALEAHRQTLADDSLDARMVDGTLRQLTLLTKVLFHVVAVVPMDATK